MAVATVFQVPLGAITVLTGLHPLAVGSHFLLSMFALGSRDDPGAAGARLVARRRARLGPAPRAAGGPGGPGRRGRCWSTGVVVTAAGPHSGDDDVTKRFGDLLLATQVHVRAAMIFALLALVLVAWVWRERGTDSLTRWLALIAVPLIAIQIGLGEYQYRHGLPWQVVVFHVTTAALVWAVILAACWGVARPAEAYGRREATLWQGTQRTASGSALRRPSGISSPQSTQTP